MSIRGHATSMDLQPASMCRRLQSWHQSQQDHKLQSRRRSKCATPSRDKRKGPESQQPDAPGSSQVGNWGPILAPGGLISATRRRTQAIATNTTTIQHTPPKLEPITATFPPTTNFPLPHSLPTLRPCPRAASTPRWTSTASRIRSRA